MSVFNLNMERADDNGLKFDSKPFPTKEEAMEEAKKRAKSFKDDIVREFARDGFDEEVRDNYVYCTANWTMTLYIYCKIVEHEI